MAGSFIGGGTGEKGVRNFVIEKRGEGEKLGPKSEGGSRRKGPSAAEAAEAKVSNCPRIFIHKFITISFLFLTIFRKNRIMYTYTQK